MHAGECAFMWNRFSSEWLQLYKKNSTPVLKHRKQNFMEISLFGYRMEARLKRNMRWFPKNDSFTFHINSFMTAIPII